MCCVVHIVCTAVVHYDVCTHMNKQLLQLSICLFLGFVFALFFAWVLIFVSYVLVLFIVYVVLV